MVADKLIIALVGPSGSGKSTIENILKNKGFNKVISHTSRDIREGEKDGVDYHYVDPSFFQDNENSFVEFVEFNDNFYGAHKNSFDSDINVIVVEPHGLRQIEKYTKDNYIDILSVGLTVSKECQRERMIKRGDSLESIEKRLSDDNIAAQMKNIDFDMTFNTEKISAEIIAEVVYNVSKSM